MKESLREKTRRGVAATLSAGALFLLTTPTAAAATDVDEEASATDTSTESASVFIVDEYNYFGNGAGDISEYTIDVDELADYNLFGVIVDGDFIEPDGGYDESIYEYVTSELTDVDGVTEEGLESQTIMISASPDNRMLGVYGSDDVGLTPETVNSAVNAMQSEAQDGDFQGAIFTGLDVAVDPIVNGGSSDTGTAATTNTSASGGASNEEVTRMAGLVGAGMTVLLVLIIGGNLAVKGVISVRDRNRKVEEAKEAVEPRLSELQRFWKRADDFNQLTPEAAIPDVDTKRALELIREAREVTNSDKQRQDAYVKIHAEYMPEDNTRGAWTARWSDKMFGVRKNIAEASYSVEDFAEIAESETDVQKAKDVVTEAEEQLSKLDADVQSGAVSLIEADKKLKAINGSLQDKVQTVADNASIRDDVEKKVSSRSDSNDYNFYTTAALTAGIIYFANQNTSSYSSRSSSYSSSSSSSFSSPTSFSSFGGGGGGGFSGGSGRF